MIQIEVSEIPQNKILSFYYDLLVGSLLVPLIRRVYESVVQNLEWDTQGSYNIKYVYYLYFCET